MIRSLALLCALFVGDAFGGNITIPTEDCTWREETYGAWNQCFGNEIVIGSCGSGSGNECDNGAAAHGIYCCPLPSYLFLACEETLGDFGQDLDCNTSPLGGECGSGQFADCDGNAHGVRCCEATYDGLPLLPVEENCYWEYTTNYGERIFCRRDDEAVFGRCGSGRQKDCGDGGGYVHGIKCCEITV